MLKRTFIHLPGVGLRGEAHFWRQGLSTWEDFLAAKRVRGLSHSRFDWLKAELQGSFDHLEDPAYFAARLQAGEHWRLFDQFRPRTAYLDIETTGTVWPGLLVTVVGLYDGQTMRQFVQGYNLREFPGAISEFDLLVTFNGKLNGIICNNSGMLWYRAPTITAIFFQTGTGYKGARPL